VVSEPQSVGNKEEGVLITGIEVRAGVEVWEVSGNRTEWVVEGEGAVGKGVRGVVVGKVDFADGEAGKDW
jgi:hypothetical protein